MLLRLLGAPFDGRVRLALWEIAALLVVLLATFGLTGVSITTLWWMLHAWRTPDTLESTRFAFGSGDGPGAALAKRTTGHAFSLIVPARHEEKVLAGTLRRLAAVHHPDVEILAVVGHDDPATEQVARAVAAEHPERIRVVLDTKWPKNKPKALNTALAECHGDITGVFDAEDEVHPDLLAHVERCLDAMGADVVQGGVQLMNYGTSWWSLHNVLEYFFWFRSRLHYHAGRRFIPLGGNTVFVRTSLLRAAGGWDEGCLAEDCDLGVRLSARGAQVVVAYEPGLITREETPPSLSSLVRQRTRWNQGFLQVLRKGDWRSLPTRRQRWLARYTLSMPLLQGLAGLLVPLAILAVMGLRLPVVVALASFVPLLIMALVVAVQAAGLRDFCRSYGHRARVRDYLRLVAGAPFYQLLLGYAALRAVVREGRGERGWEKTEHVGAHRQDRFAPAPAAQ